MARDDDEVPWTRQLPVAIGALVVVALVIGGVASVVALGAARVTGLGESRPTAQARPSLYVPSGRPTTTLDQYPAPNGTTPKASPSASPSRSATATPKPAITLTASPTQVGAGQRITLTGGYRGGSGALQIQRFEGGGWTDFPVTVTVRTERFSTYITTSHTGVNRLRVLDQQTGRASPAVRVTVG